MCRPSCTVPGDHLDSATAASSLKLDSDDELYVTIDKIRFGFHPPVGDSLLLLSPQLS